ncbi:MAG: RCC1 domain-containing protein, partial [Dehalococcoidia bacterium]
MSRRRWAGAAAMLAVALVVAAGSPRLLHGVQAAAARTAVTAATTPSTPMVAAGGRHTCALNSSGAVRCWGANDNGQLGDGTTISHQRPALVAGLSSGVTAIAAGSAHTCALTTAGGVKCWGSNANGELGDFTQVNRSMPVDVINLTSGVVAISAGDRHTCALLAAGSMQCWGYNVYGEVGNGTSGNLWLGAVDVCASGSGVGCAGGAPLTGIASMAAGGINTCAVTTGGALKCWGGNYSGQLGLGILSDSPLPPGGICPTSAEPNAACISLPTDVPSLQSGIAAVNAGQTACALTTTGGVMCWGLNNVGETGTGIVSPCNPKVPPQPFVICDRPQPEPAAVSGLSSGVAAISGGCALMLTGGVKCWGANVFGQIGDGTTTVRRTPVDVSGLSSGVTSISRGEDAVHHCAAVAAGALKCWGLNSWGQLGAASADTCFIGWPCSLVPVDVRIGADCTGRVDDARGDGLAGALVELRQNGTVLRQTATRRDGAYVLDCAAGADYTVRATLRDGQPGGPLWEVRHTDAATEAAWIEVALSVPAAATTATADLRFSDLFPQITATNVVPHSRLDTLAVIFGSTGDYITWAKSAFAPAFSSPSRPAPVKIFAFSSKTTGAYYSPGLSEIQLGPNATTDRAAENTGSPENGEWHEFGHHLFNVNISDQGFTGTNHNGYQNPDTSDSFGEAVPEFLGTLAWQGIHGGSDSQYDGFGALEPNGWKAWSSDSVAQREELGVLTLLWDLWDRPADTLSTKVVSRDGTHHVAVTYTDTVALPLSILWASMDAMGPADPTVAGFRDALYANTSIPTALKAITVDLDGDGVPDVSQLDVPFLMHGFYSINRNFTAGDATVNEFTIDHAHYHVGDPIGRTDHLDADGAGPGTVLTVRRELPYIPAANLLLNVQDGNGAPLPGATASISVTYPETSTVASFALPLGSGNLHYLELPPYYPGVLAPGDPLPACDPSIDYRVQVAVTVSYNGITSPDHLQFDNCQYLQAIEAAGAGDHALTLTATITTATPTPTASATATSSPAATATATPTATDTPTAVPTATDTPAATSTTTATPTASATPSLTYDVNSTLDAVDARPGDGVCATSTGTCTLRAAVMEAFTHFDPTRINLPAGTYRLTLGPPEGLGEYPAPSRGDLDLSRTTTIVGAGASTTIIDGNGVDRVFESAGVNTISDVTIRGGDAHLSDGTQTVGDAVWVSGGSLALERVVVTANAAGDAAIAVNGALTITDSTIEGNAGGGIRVGNGVLSLLRSSVKDNGGAGIRTE